MIDERIRALAHHHRREVLLELGDCQSSDEVSLSTLVDRLNGDLQTLHVTLLHRHLPVLAECEIVDWHRSRGLVRQGPAFAEVYPLLETIQTMYDPNVS